MAAIVIIEAIISKTGDVQNAKILRGNPMLDNAALKDLEHILRAGVA